MPLKLCLCWLQGVFFLAALPACGPPSADVREEARFAMVQPAASAAKQRSKQDGNKENPEEDARANFKKIAEDRRRARRALDLVKAERWEEALALLEKLSDIDFVVPRRREIVDVRPDGRLAVEWIPEHAIGNRSAALVRCYYQLGRLDDARPYIWRVVEQDHFDAACFRAIIELHAQDLGGVARRAGTLVEAVEGKTNRTAEKLLRYVDLVRLLNNNRWEMAIAAITSGCSCPPDNVALSGKEAYDRLAAETIADRGAEAVPPLIAALQPSPEEVHLCVVHALSRTADERALKALQTAWSRVRNYQAGQRLDAAIERLREELNGTQTESERH